MGGMCVHDLLEDRFSLPLLKGALALDAVLGTNYGPRSPGTVVSLLYRAAASQGVDALALPQGGLGRTGGLARRAARAAGAQLRLAAPVERILVREDQRCRGRARLRGGNHGRERRLERRSQEHLPQAARGAASGCGLRAPRVPGALTRPDGEAAPGAGAAARSSRGLRSRRTVRASWLPRPRTTSSAPTTMRSTRNSPQQPMLEVTSRASSMRAWHPPDKHVMSVIVQYAPYALKGGWASAAAGFHRTHPRDTRRLRTAAAGLASCASELLTPPDIEREFRITGGHWHHAELALDQFLMVRPVPGAAQYQTPLAGLFLCGAGCHPGGGVMGLGRPQRGPAADPRGRLRAMLTESEPHYRQPLLKTPFHERQRALSQLDSFVPWAGYTTVDVVHQRRAGVLRDPQRKLPLRPDADGQVPDRRARTRCAFSIAW